MAKNWWYIDLRHGCSFIPGLPSSIHGWKNEFFFISFDYTRDTSWVWEEPDQFPNKNDEILTTNEDDFKKQSNIKVPPQ